MSSDGVFPEVARTDQRTDVQSILRDAFADNKTVNWAIRSRVEHLDTLLDYSLGIAQRFGAFYVDRSANAAVVYLLPHQRKFSWFESVASIRMLRATGLRRALELWQRENHIDGRHPKDRAYIYLWYIGVRPNAQGRGHGTSALKEIMAFARKKQWPVYLETSDERDRRFYERNGFELFHTWENGIMGFPLYFYRYEP